MGEAWPPTLKAQPLYSAFRRTSESGLIRSENDAGPANVRRRYTATPDRAQWVIPSLTGTQYQTYLTFIETTLQGGALRVDMIDPLDDTVREARIIDPPGVATCLRPDPVAADRIWRVSFTLEFLP